MSDQNRWSEDRYGDRYRQDDGRLESYRPGDYYGRNAGRDGNRDQSYGRDRGTYGERGYSGDAVRRESQSYGRDSARRDEQRSFASSDRGYEPYDSAYGAYGEEVYRERSYGSDPRDSHRYDNREASGAMLHQGYRAPFAGVRGDAQSYSNAGYSNAGYRGDYGAHPRDEARSYDGRPDQGSAQSERGWWEQTRDEVSSWFGDDQAAQRRQMDDARHGQHSGRGPKGYTRSDERIREDVNDRLTYDHALDASDIDAKVSNGEVTLSGHVESRDAKRRAEDIADRIHGVKHVQNNLRVVERQTTTSFATSGATGQSATAQSGAAQTGSTQATAAKSN